MFSDKYVALVVISNLHTVMLLRHENKEVVEEMIFKNCMQMLKRRIHVATVLVLRQTQHHIVSSHVYLLWLEQENDVKLWVSF